MPLAEEVVSDRVIEFYGGRYVVPEVHEWPRTILAANVGGAVIPTLLSIYLFIVNRIYLRGIIAILIVALLVRWIARPVRGVGISVPMFIPPIVAVGIAMILSWSRAAPLAYISGRPAVSTAGEGWSPVGTV